MSLAPGTRLGSYEVVAPLGAGGMGEVYRARDTRLDRTVAIKVLLPDVAADGERRERFQREARAVAALNHPHIAILYDIGEVPNPDSNDPRSPTVQYLVMEYLDGESLAARIARGALPLDEALRHAIAIADALDKAHRAGIVHRDLKPANVMLTKTGAKLLDFGVAKLRPTAPGAVARMTAAPTTGPPLTGQGTILGTLHYMAPEQLEGKEVDARADIFSFGALVYEMVTGKKTFDGTSPASVIGAILKDEPPAMSAAQPVSPAMLDRTIMTCLAKNPDDRWQTASDLRRELTWIGQSGGADVGPRVSAAGVGLRARTGWVAAAILAVLFVCASALATALWSRTPTGDEPPMRFRFDLPATAKSGGNGWNPRVSPDGRQIVFAATTGDGKTLLWVRALDSLTARSLPGTDGADMPFWSPDSRSIGFGAGGKIKRISPSGGIPETVCDVGLDLRGSAWNADGVIVFGTAGGEGGLSRVAASGGTPVSVTTLDKSHGENSHRWPEFLPDGRHFLFTVRSEQPEYHGIYVGSIDSPVRKRVIGALSNVGIAPPDFLIFYRDGNLFSQRFDPGALDVVGDPALVAQGVAYTLGTAAAAFSVSNSGLLIYSSAFDTPGRALAWMDRRGRQLALAGEGYAPAISPDGSRVAALRIDPRTGTSDVWVVDGARGVDTAVTRHPAYDEDPVWSPDGTRLVFASQREGPKKIYEKSVGSGIPETRILDSTTNNRPMDWTADGRFIVYLSQMSGSGMVLWALPMAGDRQPVSIVGSGVAASQGHVSKDSRWIAYSSNESGRSEIYVQAFPAGAKAWTISSAGGSDPRWRRDGKELFYLASDGKLMAVSVAAAQTSTPQFGAPVALFDTGMSDAQRAGPLYDVSPDGQRFILPVGADRALPITVVVNWRAALKK
ncbi:MAG: protein kinase [Acidobacteriota bacterium]